MLFVGRFVGKLEADESNDIATAIGKVVQTIRQNGNNPQKCANKNFCSRQNDVANDGDNACKLAHRLAYNGRGRIFVVFYKKFQK